MTTEEQLQHHARIIERNRPFEAILSNPDFLEWQKAGPIARLEEIKSAIVTVDRSKVENWKEVIAELVIEYQAVANVILATALRAGEATKSKEAVKGLGNGR